jgi:hypothetical protein
MAFTVDNLQVNETRSLSYNFRGILLLAHLAKGNVSFFHHLASIVRENRDYQSVTSCRLSMMHGTLSWIFLIKATPLSCRMQLYFLWNFKSSIRLFTLSRNFKAWFFFKFYTIHILVYWSYVLCKMLYFVIYDNGVALIKKIHDKVPCIIDSLQLVTLW